MTQREGPKVTLSCANCRHCESVHHPEQGTYDISCSLAHRTIAEWITPDWCPVTTPAEVAAAAAGCFVCGNEYLTAREARRGCARCAGARVRRSRAANLPTKKDPTP